MPEESLSLSLLRLWFGPRTDRGWAATSIAPLTLTSPPTRTPGFYAVQNEMVVMQPNIAGTTNFFLGQSIVPIVCQVAGESTLRCIGTGFFISCSGLLITAAHVITDPIERQYGGMKEEDDITWRATDLKLGVMLPVNPLFHGEAYIFREITWSSFLGERTTSPLPFGRTDIRLTSDVAICQVEELAPNVPFQPLIIVQPGMAGVGMQTGKRASAIGYGELADIDLQSIGSNSFSGDFPFQFHASRGEILERFPDNSTKREVRTPGACFSASLRLPGGMSGSPIFDDEGIYVHGVVSGSLEDESGVSSLGYGSMLSHSLHIPVRTLAGKTLAELLRGNEHGFPKLHGPGDI